MGELDSESINKQVKCMQGDKGKIKKSRREYFMQGERGLKSGVGYSFNL